MTSSMRTTTQCLILNREELREEYPELEDEDIQQALLFAAAYLDDSVVELPIIHETAA